MFRGGFECDRRGGLDYRTLVCHGAAAGVRDDGSAGGMQRIRARKVQQAAIMAEPIKAVRHVYLGKYLFHVKVRIRTGSRGKPHGRTSYNPGRPGRPSASTSSLRPWNASTSGAKHAGCCSKQESPGSMSMNTFSAMRANTCAAGCRSFAWVSGQRLGPGDTTRNPGDDDASQPVPGPRLGATDLDHRHSRIRGLLAVRVECSGTIAMSFHGTRCLL